MAQLRKNFLLIVLAIEITCAMLPAKKVTQAWTTGLALLALLSIRKLIAGSNRCGCIKRNPGWGLHCVAGPAEASIFVTCGGRQVFVRSSLASFSLRPSTPRVRSTGSAMT